MPTLFCNCRKYLFGCTAFRNNSPHIEVDQGGQGAVTAEEQMYTEVCAGVRVSGSEGTLLIQSHTYLMYLFSYRNLRHGSNELIVLMGKSGASPTECVRRYKHYIHS